MSSDLNRNLELHSPHSLRISSKNNLQNWFWPNLHNRNLHASASWELQSLGKNESFNEYITIICTCLNKQVTSKESYKCHLPLYLGIILMASHKLWPIIFQFYAKCRIRRTDNIPEFHFVGWLSFEEEWTLYFEHSHFSSIMESPITRGSQEKKMGSTEGNLHDDIFRDHHKR